MHDVKARRNRNDDELVLNELAKWPVTTLAKNKNLHFFRPEISKGKEGIRLVR